MKKLKTFILPILILCLLISFIFFNRYEIIGYQKETIRMSLFDSVKLDILIALEKKKPLPEEETVIPMKGYRIFHHKITTKQYLYFNAFGFLGKDDNWQMIDPFGKLANFIMELYLKYQLDEIYQMSLVLETSQDKLPGRIVADANWYAISSKNELKEAFEYLSLQYTEDENITMYDFWLAEKRSIELNAVIQYNGLIFKLVEIDGNEFIALFKHLKK